MTREELDMEIQKGLDDISHGRVVSADEVEEEIEKMYGIMRRDYEKTTLADPSWKDEGQYGAQVRGNGG